MQYLENQRELIKADEDHQQWQLQNIGARIREIKKRITKLEKEDNIEFEEKEFSNGKIIRNKEINRIQILFESIPDEDIRKAMKSNGFHWSRQEGAWQRQFNQNTIRVTNRLFENVLNKENEEELE